MRKLDKFCKIILGDYNVKWNNLEHYCIFRKSHISIIMSVLVDIIYMLSGYFSFYLIRIACLYHVNGIATLVKSASKFHLI